MPNNMGLQGGFDPHSKPRFTGTEAGAEKRLVGFYVGDDEADWLLDEASHASAPRALDILKRVAPRLGFLQAEHRWSGDIFERAVYQAGERNGLGIGPKRFDIWEEIEPLIDEARERRAAELAEPHQAEARRAVLAGRDRNAATPDSFDRDELKGEVEAAARVCASKTGLPLDAILDDLIARGGLTAEEIGPTLYSEAPWRAGVLKDMKRSRRIAEEARDFPEIEGWKAPRLLANPIGAANVRERFEVTMFGDLDDEASKEWLVDDLLGAGEFSCFWGMPGCGKSVIVGDAAFHVASGLDWHGKPVKRGLVVFIAAERADLTKRRFAALRKRHGGADIPLAVVKGRLDLTSSPQDAKDIVAAVQRIEDQTGEQCVWVIVDTVARTFGAGDENKQADMGAYVKACDLIRDDLSAHVTVIHHCSRSGEKPRGSIALDGAVDATFRVAKSGAIHTVAIDKENDAPDGGMIRFRMEGVELGTDRRGKVTMAPVAVPDTETVAAFEVGGVSVALKGPGAKARAVLQRALSEAGEDSPDGRRAVAVGELRRRLREAFTKPGQKPDSLAAIERREFSGLTNRGDAERSGEWIMLPAGSHMPGGGEKAGDD